jgi:hypothetical protein
LGNDNRLGGGQITVTRSLIKVAEIRVSYGFVNAVAIAAGIVLSVTALYLFSTIESMPEPTLFDLAFFLVMFVAFCILHELSHGLAALTVAGLKWKDLKFGWKWRVMVGYCLCLKPISLSAYRWYALFPLLITVPLAMLLALVWPALWSVLLLVATLGGTVGDMIMLMHVWNYDGSLHFLEHESGIGGDIYRAV